MSLSYQKLTPILVEDPLTLVNDVQTFPIVQGGNKVSFKAFTSGNISSSSMQFSCPPPSAGTIINRNIRATVPVRLTFTGRVITNNVLFAGPTSLLNADLDAPRFMPLNGSLETLQVNINNTSVSQAQSDIIHALTRYDICPELRRKEYSTSAAYPDCSYNYSDLVGSARNPLGSYSNVPEGCAIPRGGVPFNIVANAAVVPALGAGTAATAQVDMCISESLILSPLFWGKLSQNRQGLYNVNSLDVNLSFLAQAGFRMWSHCPIVATSGADQITSVIDTITVQFNGFNAPAFSFSQNFPQLLFQYMTPNILTRQRLDPNLPITYNYHNVTRYPTDIGSIAFGGAPTPVSSNNIQLSSIPERIFVYIRPNNATLQSRADITDCYLSISNITVQWANQNTVLSTATQDQLYNICLDAGLSMDWAAFSGEGVYNGAFPPNALSDKYGGVGSVLCLETAKTIQLDGDQCPGMNGQFQLQVTAYAQNKNRSGAWDNLPLTMYIVCVSMGTFTITGLGSAQQQEGVVSAMDILDAQAAPSLAFDRGERFGGGDFLSSLGNFASKVNDFLKESKLISTVSGLIPHPIAQAVNAASKVVGYGEGGCDGSGAMGGMRMTKSALRSRLG